MELCTSFWEELILMGVTIMFSLNREIKNTRPNREIKNTRPILSLERRLWYGIKDWDILEKRAFEHYTVKAWFNVCLIAPWILISVNISYMVNIIE